MVTIGNSNLPGTITTIESATATGANIGAPGDVVIVGQADLDNGNASANELKRITRPKESRDEFGDPDNSMLARAVTDALVEGAYPVFAIATDETSVSGEDLSGLSSNTGTLANAPIREDTDSITFTINSTTLTTVLEHDQDPADGTPGTDEVLVNPVSGKFNIDSNVSVGNAADTVDYEHFDYTSAHDAVTTEKSGDEFVREAVDLVFSLSENSAVRDDLETTVDSMESSGWLAIGQAGAGKPYIADTGSYTDSYDNSRLQLYYPSRNGDNETILGSVAGRRAALGIDASPIFKTIDSQKDLQFNLERSDQENLVNAKVIPLEERSGGARIIQDLTTVADDNLGEDAWRHGFARLVTDFVYDTVESRSQSFIGKLHTQDARNALQGILSDDLQSLLASDAITAFSITVERKDDTTASVDIGIDTTDPLENIETTISAGDVQNAVGTE